MFRVFRVSGGHEGLFEKVEADLLQDLYDIPQRACNRKASARFLLVEGSG